MKLGDSCSFIFNSTLGAPAFKLSNSTVVYSSKSFISYIEFTNNRV